MTELLLRLFVRDYKNTSSPSVHSAIGKLAGVTGIVCNILLFLGKLAAVFFPDLCPSSLTRSTTCPTPHLPW